MNRGEADVNEITCEQALARLYEYLDGELDPGAEAEVRRHLEICKRCYPLFNFEGMFLDYLQERGSEPVEDPDLRARVETLLSQL